LLVLFLQPFWVSAQELGLCCNFMVVKWYDCHRTQGYYQPSPDVNQYLKLNILNKILLAFEFYVCEILPTVWGSSFIVIVKVFWLVIQCFY
jgi:hypothetical protein